MTREAEVIDPSGDVPVQARRPWQIETGDPARVVLSTGCGIPPWRRRELDEAPELVVWDPNDADEDKFLLSWLNAQAPGWTTEIEILHDGGYAEAKTPEFDATTFRVYLRFPNPDAALAYRAWRISLVDAWEARHALVQEGERFCWECGGPVEVKEQTEEFQVRDVLVKHRFHGPWCQQCETSDHIPIDAASERGRILVLNKALREAFGIPQGERTPRDVLIREIIETDGATTDEAFSVLAAAAALRSSSR